MMNNLVCKKVFVIIILSISFSVVYAQTTTVNFTLSNDDFVNPERGFYRYTETRSTNYTLLDSSTLAGYRLLHTPAGNATYQVYSSLIFRYFVLESFKSGPISTAYLQNMATDFATARKAGVKIIPRFAYTITPTTGTCGSWICPPYGDASKTIILNHIAQLKPILMDNADVIAVVQMGFIGTWGENYYTDFFGDASQSPYSLTSTNWNDRIQVLDSLLSAVHQDIQVQVRYPQMKQKAIYGAGAPVTSAALTMSEAWMGTRKSRIGFHNDCFLANYDDYGTYANYDNGNSDTTRLKKYKADDSKYVMTGGETCNPSTFSTCDAQGGVVLGDMARLHYTYLNAQYNNDVNNTWVTNNCITEIKRKLGYRLALNSVVLQNSVQRGGTFSYTFNITNSGFSAPSNKKLLRLIFINTANYDEFSVNLPHDIRQLLPGAHQIGNQVCIPPCMPQGTYRVYLHIADHWSSLRNRPEYSIRLANTGIWNSANGYHDLGHTFTVQSTMSTCGSTTIAQRTNNIVTWTGPTNGIYGTPGHWSSGRVPDGCDHVVIPIGKNISITTGQFKAKTLTIQQGGNMTVSSGASIVIEP